MYKFCKANDLNHQIIIIIIMALFNIVKIIWKSSRKLLNFQWIVIF